MNWMTHAILGARCIDRMLPGGCKIVPSMSSGTNGNRVLLITALGTGAAVGLYWFATRKRHEPKKPAKEPDSPPRFAPRIVHFEEEITATEHSNTVSEIMETPTKSLTSNRWSSMSIEPSSATFEAVTPVRNNASKVVDADVQSINGIQDPVLKQQFDDAAERIKAMENLSNPDKLALYGLYKQTTVGDADDVFSPLRSSSWNIIAEQAKHSAWLQYKGVNKDMAAKGYLALVSDLESIANTSSPRPVEDDNPMGGKAVSLPQEEHGDSSEHSIDADTNEGKLLHAALYNNVDEVKRLVEGNGVDINYGDDQGQTALHLAADRGHEDAVKTLIALGADVNARDKDGISVLQAAVIGGGVNVCRLLLEAGSYPDQFDFDGDTPRTCAKDDGDEEMQKLFEAYP